MNYLVHISNALSRAFSEPAASISHNPHPTKKIMYLYLNSFATNSPQFCYIKWRFCTWMSGRYVFSTLMKGSSEIIIKS